MGQVINLIEALRRTQPDAKFVAILCREARQAVIAHRDHFREQPDAHRGCLWCEDGRLSHWLSEARDFHQDDELINHVWCLYDRAYPRDYDGIM